METGEIVRIFTESGYQIDPGALDILKNEGSHELIKNILDSIDSSVFVVGAEHIAEHIGSLDYAFRHPVKPAEHVEPVIVPDIIPDNIEVSAVVNPQEPEVQALPVIEAITKSRPHSDRITTSPPVTIISDITDQSTCIGEYTDFVQYFKDRYALLGDMLRKRISSRPIESLKRRNLDSREPLSVIGMVQDKKTTANGHKLLEIEDTTGSLRVLVHKERDRELFEASNSVLLDEVIAVTGTLSSDGNIMFANKITWPDLPNSNPSLDGKKPKGKAVFISDIHVGSNTFLEDAWLRFVDWLGDVDDINYLLIAGDVVDGIGIFPNQDKELAITDIYEQYEKAAEYLNAVPGHIRIIISPGNHDAVRQAEPQPRFPERITRMFRSDITFVGNPAMVELGGAKVLMYHGRSMDDIIASIPGYSYNEPEKPMIEMLRVRHLSPIYGGRVSIAPEKKDHFVISEVPDILHCGHVHTVGVKSYKGVLAVNSGTWQSQTEFQKRMNLDPTPARATVVDLSNMKYEILAFN
ncbi:MAG: DNA-directed DNA polymerase II small subunit [Candidatus Methanoperedens sp.]|jgi:DNA polymerase II small subunit|nr:DNA-directed DNA polymerase II small subunit [Candidatus Methanoperedens sp.]PKL54688.1 MAG: DNA polymerase II [Candidatus Methanoperedenaceae archaeon HGW-Methanoperedenaceae-1]